MPIDEGTWEKLVQDAIEYVNGGQYTKAVAAIIDIDLYVRRQVLAVAKPGAYVVLRKPYAQPRRPV